MEKRVYTEIKDVGAIMSKMEEYLMDFNGMSKRPMNLAMFLYAVEHVSRICRVLKQPGAHMLLAGVGGSGRQSLSRLAAHISEMKTFQIEISKSYTKVEWRDDLKKMMKAAGAEGVHTVFLFSDTQIKEESFVEDINNILNSGEVPSMFPYDEKASIIELVRPIAKKQKKNFETPAELWAFFVELCKNNLVRFFFFFFGGGGGGGGERGALLSTPPFSHASCLPPLPPALFSRGTLTRARSLTPPLSRFPAAHHPLLLAHRRGLPRAAAPVPVAHQLLHHRLVPAVAQRRAGGRRREVPGRGRPPAGDAPEAGGHLQDIPQVGPPPLGGVQGADRALQLRHAHVVPGASHHVHRPAGHQAHGGVRRPEAL